LETIIEPLARKHNKRGFRCGNDQLDYYIGKIAAQHIKNGVSRTFVLVPKANLTVIIGYYSITTCDVRVESFQPSDSKKLPRSHPLPAGRLARLAVATRYQGQGFGEKLLIHAMRNFLSAQEAVGMCALFVDAKDEDAGNFYRKYGFIQSSDDPLQFYLPTATIRKALGPIQG
jgi:ribosomal protein S18 acetylase RimI-like enzyme